MATVELTLLLGSAMALAAQTALPPDALRLAKIKARAAVNLARLPNYTCLETIERSQRRVSSRRFELLDIVRLEVTVVDQKELYAWPGSQGFEDKDITEMVSGGSIGNGSFASHARSVFMTKAPVFTPAGEDPLHGLPAIRYNYRVPASRSAYKMRVPPMEAIVGYQGSFWVDPATLDLLRLDVIMNEIPARLPIRAGSEVLRYGRYRIGSSDFLLPQSSEMVLTDSGGNEHRNRIRFSGCREYAIESVIRFADVPERPILSKAPPGKVEIPKDLDLDLSIANAIEGGVSAVGDVVEAALVRDVKQKGRLVIPKGAKLTGRIVRLERWPGIRQEPHWVLGLIFHRIEFENQFALLHLRMNPIVGTRFFAPVPGRSAGRGYIPPPESPAEDPRIGILYLRGDQPKLPAGTRTLWRTGSPIEEKK